MRNQGNIPAEGDPQIAPTDGVIEPEAVRVQLARTLASTEFKAADRNHRFLCYIVEEALAGRGERIKAYNIAVEVFGREASFDPQIDPIVRIEASRLRRSLEHYYIVAGEDDPIRIEIPKGGYVPIFQARPGRDSTDGGAPSQPAAAPEAAEEPPVLPQQDEATVDHVADLTFRPSSWRTPIPAAWGGVGISLMAVALALGLKLSTAPSGPDAVVEAGRNPSIIVLPFENVGAGPADHYVAESITEEITTGLEQFQELFVYAPETGARYGTATSYEQLHRELGVRYILEGSVRQGRQVLRVTARLIDAANGIQVWASAYEKTGKNGDALFRLQSDIARSVVIEVAQPYGAIATADMEIIRGKAPESLSAWECVVQVIDYYRRMSPTRVENARGCLERATRSEPDHADAWALLSMNYLDHVRLRMVPRSEDNAYLDQALNAAQKAVELAPRSGLVHQAMLLARSFRGEVEQAVAVGERALALNPNNSDILATFGMRLALMGQWERGLKLLDQAIARNPAHPGWYHAAPALNFYRLGRYSEALEEAEQIDAPDWIHTHVILAMIHGQVGDHEAAKVGARKILEIDADFEEYAWYELRLRSFPQDVAKHMVDGLRKAGLSIPEQPSETTDPKHPVQTRPRRRCPAARANHDADA